MSEVEGFVSRGVSGIVLAPLDEAALVAPVADAAARKIPVVIFDSGLKGNDYVSFVATDNRKGGRLAGERLAALLHDRGKVVLLRYAEGSRQHRRARGRVSSTRSSAHKGIEVVSSNQYGGADVEGAYKKSEALLSRYKKPDGSARRRRHLLPERVDDARDAARAAGQRLGRQGEVRRLRRVRHAREGARATGTSTASSCRIPSTWATSA